MQKDERQAVPFVMIVSANAINLEKTTLSYGQIRAPFTVWPLRHTLWYVLDREIHTVKYRSG